MSASKIKQAMKHSNKLGAGAKKRKKLSPKDKVTTVMNEWKRGTLHSGSGRIVKKREQASQWSIVDLLTIPR